MSTRDGDPVMSAEEVRRVLETHIAFLEEGVRPRDATVHEVRRVSLYSRKVVTKRDVRAVYLDDLTGWSNSELSDTGNSYYTSLEEYFVCSGRTRATFVGGWIKSRVLPGATGFGFLAFYSNGVYYM